MGLFAALKADLYEYSRIFNNHIIIVLSFEVVFSFFSNFNSKITIFELIFLFLSI